MGARLKWVDEQKDAIVEYNNRRVWPEIQLLAKKQKLETILSETGKLETEQSASKIKK